MTTYNTNNSPDICQACSGRGFQMNIQTGINERCPMCSRLIYIIEGFIDDQARLATAQQNKIDELQWTIKLERIDDQARFESVRNHLNKDIRKKRETISELQDVLKVAEMELADSKSTLGAYRRQNTAQHHIIYELNAANRDLATELDAAIQIGIRLKADINENIWRTVGIIKELEEEVECMRDNKEDEQ